jgi:hypothetical protein
VWLQNVLNELLERPPRSYGDQNMWAAKAAALILGSWAMRVSRAKAFDPRRPVKLRQDDPPDRGHLQVQPALRLLPVAEARQAARAGRLRQGEGGHAGRDLQAGA